MIIDAHHHLWDTRHLRYGLFERIPALNHPFLVEDYERVAAGARIESSICVEASSAGPEGMAELAWLREQADRSSRVKGIVAWAPIERLELPVYLERIADLHDPRIVGVRRSFEFEPPDFPCRPETVSGVRRLAAFGFSFDLVLFHPSLRATIDLVRQCPEVSFILDHLAKPPIRERRLEPWSDEFAALAALPNVVCKISGMTTEADREAWIVDDLKPYFERAVECFGWDRLLFGSDWPVCDVARGIEPWLEAVTGLLDGVPPADRERFFAGNAIRVYRLRAWEAGRRSVDG
jgi:L-fuconolactonase